LPSWIARKRRLIRRIVIGPVLLHQTLKILLHQTLKILLHQTLKILLHQTLKNYTVDTTVASVDEYTAGGGARSSNIPVGSGWRASKLEDNTAARVDLTLLASALFLQRFSLPFGNTFLMLDLVPVVFLLVYQFGSGQLVIQYDRLLWFLAIVAASTYSLWLNFNSKLLTSYFLLLTLYWLLTLSRPSTPGQYDSTLRTFQFLVMLLSCLAVAQFFAQFVVDGRKLIMFYGIVPDFLLEFFYRGGENTIIPLPGFLIKSNGLFLSEPSTLSQVTAFGILIEILEFRRPRYLLAMVSGFLLAYSGTGLMILLVFLPLAGLRNHRAGLAALAAVTVAFGLIVTGIIDLSVFLGRAGEFEDTHASGFLRFVAPFHLAARQFDTAYLQALLFGSGPGTAKNFNGTVWYSAFTTTWFKLFIEYGIIGSSIILCFVASCLRRSRCPGVMCAAFACTYVFVMGSLSTWFMTVVVVLCTLHAPEPRPGRIVDPRRSEPAFAAGSGAGRL
jgi:hypothetical protein